MRKHITHFSLFPSGSADWVEDRVARDGSVGHVPSHLWLIGGTLYDLSTYLDAHPGGRFWLEVTRGTDCTDAFEVHHINMTRALSVLGRFAVGHQPKQLVGATASYVWSDQGFYRTTRRKVREVLRERGVATGPTNLMKFLTCVAVLLFAVLFAGTCKTGSVVFATGCGYSIFVLMGIGHNFFHQRDTPWRFLFDFSLYSSTDWRVSHAISHHLYPNLDLDLEASALEPFVSFMRNRPTNSWLVYFYWWPLNWVIPVQQAIDHWWRIFTGRSVARPEDAIVIVEVMALVWCCGFPLGLALFVHMQGVATLLLQLLSTPVHRSELSWTEGCPAAALDYGEHTLLSTQEYLCGLCVAWPRLGLLVSLFGCAGFNQHVTHHLFPTVDVSRHHLVTEIVRAQAAEFGLARHPPQSWWSLARSTAATWRRAGDSIGYRPPPLPPPPQSRRARSPRPSSQAKKLRRCSARSTRLLD